MPHAPSSQNMSIRHKPWSFSETTSKREHVLPHLRRAAPAALAAIRAQLVTGVMAARLHLYRADATTGVLLAAGLTTGAELKTWILLVCGNIAAALLAIRALGLMLKKDWGEMITMIVMAVVLFGFIYAPDTTNDLFVGVWDKVTGSA